MNNCGWCGRVIVGEGVSPVERSPVIVGKGEIERAVVPELSCGFCCDGCAWAFEAEVHLWYGLGGTDLREHLVNEHGLVHPPGAPGGSMSIACCVYMTQLAESVITFIEGGVEAIKPGEN